MSLLKKVEEARAELDAQGQDPWSARLGNALHGVDAISTAALLDLLLAKATTGTARRLAAVMRSLHFIPIKSRRLMPGGRATLWCMTYAERNSSASACVSPIKPDLLAAYATLVWRL